MSDRFRPKRARAARALLLAVPALAFSAAPAVAQREPARLIRLEPGALSPEVASALELDVASHDGVLRPDRPAEVIAYGRELAALDRLGVRYELAVPDLEAFYAARLVPGGIGGIESAAAHGAWLQPPFAQGGMGGYYTLAELESVLDQIHAAYPALTTQKASIGQSVEGREQWMLKVSDNPLVDEGEPEVRYDALHHAREPQGMQTTLWFLLWALESYGSDSLATYLIDERELYFVPCVNPDGYEYNRQTNPGGGGLWRKNRRDNGGGVFGVDLNRNYASFWGWDDLGSSSSTSSETYRGPAPASEPEVANMQAFFAQRAFATAQSNHTYSNLWLYPYGYDAVLPANDPAYLEVSALATADNGYLVGPAATALYLANGITSDHEHEVHGTMAWTPEIGSDADGFWPPTSRIVPLAEENLSAFQTTALAAGAYVQADTAFDELGDGDGYFEGGERLAWPRLRNSGRQASPTVTVALSTKSPWASAVVPLDVVAGVAPFSTATSAEPVELLIDPAAPGGAAIDYTLSVTYAGWTQTHAGQVLVGELRPYLIDTLEVDRGWTAGVPGDDATTGLWERGDPLGTSSSGQEVNPEDDATPDPGVNAFVTGNGGGSAGNDDVDGGVTTLRSPLFDLSGVDAARLSYQRWYALMTSLDDSLEVSISSDAGASWTPLETVSTHQNAWTRVSHELSGLVAFTDRMQLSFEASDLGSGSLVEAAVDDLELEVYDADPRICFYGPVQAGGTVQLNVSGQPGARYWLQWSSGVAPSLLGSGGGGALAWNRLLPGQSAPVAGTVPSGGLDQRDLAVPAAPGTTVLYRAVTRLGSETRVSNTAALAIP